MPISENEVILIITKFVHELQFYVKLSRIKLNGICDILPLYMKVRLR